MNACLQARQTWVRAIRSRSLWAVSQKSGMIVRTSGGTPLIGARLFLQNRMRRRTSKASCSRASI
jgi:hypothetical protein